MKKSTELINIFVESARDTINLHTMLAQQYCLEILQEKEATTKASAILFDEDDKPVTNSEYGPGSDDVASADVVRVWCDGDFIYADLYFYYLKEWSNSVLITNDREFDWITLLDYLNNHL
jgi:hypothetical protein